MVRMHHESPRRWAYEVERITGHKRNAGDGRGRKHGNVVQLNNLNASTR